MQSLFIEFTINLGSEYTGILGQTSRQLRDWHAVKIAALATSGADILACETVPCIDEVKALSSLLVNEMQHYPVDVNSSWISMACKSGNKLNSGEFFSDAIRAIEDPNETADLNMQNKYFGIGINCTDPENINDLLDIVHDGANSNRLVIVYPNSGEIWHSDTSTWSSKSSDTSCCVTIVAVDFSRII
jgi:homocysteine S-methyltransferase